MAQSTGTFCLKTPKLHGRNIQDFGADIWTQKKETKDAKKVVENICFQIPEEGAQMGWNLVILK